MGKAERMAVCRNPGCALWLVVCVVALLPGHSEASLEDKARGGVAGFAAALEPFAKENGVAKQAEEEANEIIQLVDKALGSEAGAEELGEVDKPEDRKAARDARRVAALRHTRPHWKAAQEKRLSDAAQLQATFKTEMASIRQQRATEAHTLSEQAAIKEEAKAQHELNRDHEQDRAELKQAIAHEKTEEQEWLQTHKAHFQALRPKLEQLETALGEVATHAQSELQADEAEVGDAEVLAAAWQSAQADDPNLQASLKESNIHGAAMVKDATSGAEEAADDMRELEVQTAASVQAVEHGSHWDIHKLQKAITGVQQATLGEARGLPQKAHKKALKAAQSRACDTHGKTSAHCLQATAAVKRFAELEQEALAKDKQEGNAETQRLNAETVEEVTHEASSVRQEQHTEDEQAIQGEVAAEKAKFADGAQPALDRMLKEAVTLEEQAESTLDRAKEVAQWQSAEQRELRKEAAGVVRALEKHT